MEETIQIYLLEALRLYLSKCEQEHKTPSQEIRDYFNQRINELNGK